MIMYCLGFPIFNVYHGPTRRLERRLITVKEALYSRTHGSEMLLAYGTERTPIAQKGNVNRSWRPTCTHIRVGLCTVFCFTGESKSPCHSERSRSFASIIFFFFFFFFSGLVFRSAYNEVQRRSRRYYTLCLGMLHWRKEASVSWL